jgi:hypothetical protein
MSVETKTGLVRRFFSRTSYGQIAVRLFLCFCIFAPFDTTRRSDGTGRLFARRRIGYWGEQNGQSVERGGSRAVFCRTRIGLFESARLDRPLRLLTRSYIPTLI